MSKHKRDRSRRKEDGTNQQMRVLNYLPVKISKKYANFGERHPCLDPGGFHPNTPKIINILIIGSITSPQGISGGYYYTSPTNDLWRMLDKVIGLPQTSGFEKLQNDINGSSPNVKLIRKQFVKKLNKYKIGICDILKACWVQDVNSPDDRKIIMPIRGAKKGLVRYYDDEICNAMKENPNLVVVVDGSLTKRIFKKVILDTHPSLKNTIRYVKSPCKWNHILKDVKEIKAWHDAFKDAGII